MNTHKAARKSIAATLRQMKYFPTWAEDAEYIIRRLAKAGLRIVKRNKNAKERI